MNYINKYNKKSVYFCTHYRSEMYAFNIIDTENNIEKNYTDPMPIIYKNLSTNNYLLDWKKTDCKGL